MWVYVKTEAGWTVGFYTPSGVWVALRDYVSEDVAMSFVHYLNGGEAADGSV